LLNNDLSAGQPLVLQHIREQHVLPPLHAGWTVRRKSTHFKAYDSVAKKFAKLLGGIDPWLINAQYSVVQDFDFQKKDADNALIAAVEQVLKKTAKKYKEYKITDKPFVMVKADVGTYGMGVMTVRSADDIRALTQAQRERMAVVKEGLPVRDVLVQEGVPSVEHWGASKIAEPVVYMIDRFVVGGFYRTNHAALDEQNLNTPDMSCEPLSFISERALDTTDLNVRHNRFYQYGVVARLGMLAAANELEHTDPEQIVV
jgi:glutamate--cysteine ligase